MESASLQYAKRAALFAGLLVVPGAPIVFAMLLVMSGFGMATIAPVVAPALVCAFLGYTWVARMGRGEPSGTLVGEVVAGAVLIALLSTVVAVAAGAMLVPVAAATLVSVAAAAAGGWFAARRGGESKAEEAEAATPIGAKEVIVSDQPLVGIILGSESDRPVMGECATQLEELGVPYEMLVASAHRQPDRVHEWAESAAERGLRAIIAAAGKAAHLGGVVASSTTLPVIAVPMKTSDLGGLDSLLSTVQMPSGVPVACVAINGARNAAILATQILGTGIPKYADAVEKLKSKMAEG